MAVATVVGEDDDGGLGGIRDHRQEFHTESTGTRGCMYSGTTATPPTHIMAGILKHKIRPYYEPPGILGL